MIKYSSFVPTALPMICLVFHELVVKRSITSYQLRMHLGNYKFWSWPFNSCLFLFLRFRLGWRPYDFNMYLFFSLCFMSFTVFYFVFFSSWLIYKISFSRFFNAIIYCIHTLSFLCIIVSWSSQIILLSQTLICLFLAIVLI